jgi:hypothetical protein
MEEREVGSPGAKKQLKKSKIFILKGVGRTGGDLWIKTRCERSV